MLHQTDVIWTCKNAWSHIFNREHRYITATPSERYLRLEGGIQELYIWSVRHERIMFSI